MRHGKANQLSRSEIYGPQKKGAPERAPGGDCRAASLLFEQKGITAASMDEIAKSAGYSKATLYVYYKNKEEIVAVLVMESMKKLYASITAALEQKKATEERYQLICQGLVQYQQKYPLYFGMLLEHIRIPSETPDCSPEEAETG